MNKIKISIQEIVDDFERLISEDIRLTTIDDIATLEEWETKEYLEENKKLCEKYIPTYKDLLPKDYFGSDDVDKGIILYQMLYKNFKEIFFSLV